MDLGAVLVCHYHALGGSGVGSEDHAILPRETHITIQSQYTHTPLKHAALLFSARKTRILLTYIDRLCLSCYGKSKCLLVQGTTTCIRRDHTMHTNTASCFRSILVNRLMKELLDKK